MFGWRFPATACLILLLALVTWRQLPRHPVGEAQSLVETEDVAIVLPAAKPLFEAKAIPGTLAGIAPVVAHDVEALTNRLKGSRSLDVALAELPEVRLTLLRAYALVRGEEAAPELIEILHGSPYHRERLDAYQLLGAVGPQSAMITIFDEIIEAWDRGEDIRRLLLSLKELALNGTGPIEHGREIAEGILLIAARHEHAHTRLAAAEAVLNFVSRNGESELWIVDRLCDLGFKSQAATTLSLCPSRPAHPIVGDAIATILDRSASDIHPSIQAIRRLAPVEDELAEAALLSVIMDDEIPRHQRRDAAMAYGKQAGAAGARRILDQVDDYLLTPIVRHLPPQEALAITNDLDPAIFPQSLRVMVQLFHDDRSALDQFALDYRDAIREEAKRIIRKASAPPDPRARPDPKARIAEFLAARSGRLVSATRLTRSETPEDQLEAIRLIALIGAFELLPELADMTWSKHSRVRRYARAVANAMLTSPEPLGPVESTQTNEGGSPDVFARIAGGFLEGMSQSK